jgi:hypothetical protein
MGIDLAAEKRSRPEKNQAAQVREETATAHAVRRITYFDIQATRFKPKGCSPTLIKGNLGQAQ